VATGLHRQLFDHSAAKLDDVAVSACSPDCADDVEHLHQRFVTAQVQFSMRLSATLLVTYLENGTAKLVPLKKGTAQHTNEREKAKLTNNVIQHSSQQ
jgi:hypothetical protein